MSPLDRHPRFGRVVTAMVTPFADDGSLDLDAAAQLARWLVDHGSEGLVVAGTTGEGPVLTDDERTDLFRVVAEAVTVPVIAGTGTNDTRHSVELTRAATAAGVDAVLVVTPYYNRPSQVGLLEHFAAVAGATRLPVLLYDIPVRTGRRIAHATMLEVVRRAPNVVGVKDATGDPAGTARLIARAPASFEVYSGDDSLTLPLLAVGAVGVVSVASHWAGPRFAEMASAYAQGDTFRAQQVNASLLDSYEFESTEEFPNPLPAKAACRALGLAVGHCRPPLGPVPDRLEDDARAMLDRLHAGVPVGGPVA